MSLPPKSEMDPAIQGMDDIQNAQPDASVMPDPEKSPLPEEQQSATRKIRGFKWAALCFSLYVTIFLYGMDTTISAVVVGPVVETFGDPGMLVFLGGGFALGSVAVILLVGEFFGCFDMKKLFMGSVGLFEVGSILCGAAPNMNTLIAARVISGVGAAGVYLGGLNFLAALTSEKERGMYTNAIGLSFGTGCVCGPLLAGALSASSATWRMAFYINAPLGAVLSPIYIICLPSISWGTGTVFSKLRKIDWIGFVLSAAVWCVFTVAFTFAGSIWAWNDARTIATLVVFGVLLVAFILHQTFTKGMLPVYLFRSRLQVLLYITTSAATTSLNVTLFYLPLYFQFVAGDSALLSAVRLLPFIAVFAFFNVLSGRLLHKIGYYMAYYLFAGIVITAGGATLYTVTTETPKGLIYFYSVLVALGASFSAQIGYTIATIDAAKIGDKAKVDAISIQNFAQLGAIVICLVLGSQIFQGLAVRNLSGILVGFTSDQIHSAVAGTTSNLLESLPDNVRQNAIEAIVSAMSYVYILVIVAGGLLILCSLAMKRERIS